MRDACRYKKRFLAFDRLHLKKVFQGLGPNRRRKFLFCDARFQSQKQRRPRLCRNDVPHFGFSPAAGRSFVRARIFIIRVHLNRKLVGRKYEFHEQRKILHLCAAWPAPLCRQFRPGLSQRFPRERAIRDQAPYIRQPSFTNSLRKIFFVRKDRRKRTRSPDARSERWYDTKRSGSHELSRGLRSRKEFV